ncbi:MAG: hypothetical protein R2838_15940 [Caldilineaceae bacterium]
MAMASWSEGTLPTPTLVTPGGTPVNAVGVTPTVEPTMGALVYTVDTGAGIVRFVVRHPDPLHGGESPAGRGRSPGQPDRRGELQRALRRQLTGAVAQLDCFNNVNVAGTLDVTWNVTPADSTAPVQLAYIPETTTLSTWPRSARARSSRTWWMERRHHGAAGQRGRPTGSPWGWPRAYRVVARLTTRCTGRPTRFRPAPSPTWHTAARRARGSAGPARGRRSGRGVDAQHRSRPGLLRDRLHHAEPGHA